MTSIGSKAESEVDRTVAAAERTLSILDAFLSKDGPLKLKEIEVQTGLFRSVILRYMLSLEKLHYVYRRADGRYQLGSRAYRLGKSYQSGFQLAEYVQPALNRLVEKTGETASFYIREGDSRLCLFRKNSPQTLRVSLSEGRIIPLDAASTDQILREFGDGRGYRAAEPNSLVRATSGIIDTWSGSVSVPVIGEGNSLVGALTVSGPVQRFDISNKLTWRMLLAEAFVLASALGCTSVPRLERDD